MLERILSITRKVLPERLAAAIRKPYHSTLAFLAALRYGFPSKKVKVVAITGTKGKTSATEIVNAILEEAGYKTALSNTIRFKVGPESTDNLYKMSMPGRFFVQKFLRRAVNAGCQYVVLEVTSQGAILNRHRFISFDALIFTNIAPEHIEAHGSFEKYVAAKLSIADAVAKSSKKPTILVANADDAQTARFMEKPFDQKVPYSLLDADPYKILPEGFDMIVHGTPIHSHLSGEFNIYNELAAIAFAKTQGIGMAVCKKAIEHMTLIRGRVEKIDEGQNFEVVVDYAHTPDSLQKFYDVFKGKRRICILGNTGGGRDVWKRDEMAKIAAHECDEIILTNEDPYDDDPQQIVNDMASAIPNTPARKIMDRREAIAHAFTLAQPGDAVLITGKGTDPYIMGPNDTKIPWSDAQVCREELRKLTK